MSKEIDMKGRLYGLDLFSGIGGNTLGLGEWVKTIAYCEQDKHAQSVLLSRMSDGSIEPAPIWDDVSTLGGSMFDVPIDIIVAGFPCQDISLAGKGAGLAGKRSGLFFEIMRLAKEIQPTFLFLENVPAIRTRGLDTVVQELTKAGYDCRWVMLSAAEVGAKHKRERWFLLAHTSDQRRQQNCDGSSCNEAKNERRCKDQNYLSKSSCSCFFTNGNCETEPDVGRVADGLSTTVVESGPDYLNPSYWEEEPEGIPRITQEKEQRVERVKRLGNGVVPLQAKTAFAFLLKAEIQCGQI